MRRCFDNYSLKESSQFTKNNDIYIKGTTKSNLYTYPIVIDLLTNKSAKAIHTWNTNITL